MAINSMDPSLVLNDWPSIVNGKSDNGYHSELMLKPPSSNDLFAGQMGFFDQTKMLVYLRRVASTVTIYGTWGSPLEQTTGTRAGANGNEG
jgi:hypothetical protein